MLKMAGITGISQTAMSFVKALCSCQNQKFTHAALIVVDYVYLIIVSAYYLTRKQYFNFSKLYMVGQLVSGVSSWMFYILILSKQKIALVYGTDKD